MVACSIVGKSAVCGLDASSCSTRKMKDENYGLQIILLLVIELLSGCAESQPQRELIWVPPTDVALEQLRLQEYQCDRDAELGGNTYYRPGPNMHLYHACMKAHGWKLEYEPQRESTSAAQGVSK